MKITDVVTQMQLVLPKYTDYFSRTIEIASIVSSGKEDAFPLAFPTVFGQSDGVAIITTVEPHGLVTDEGISISNVQQSNAIDSVSKDGLIFTFTTIKDHDLTFEYPGYETVKIDGFSDAEWNGSFKLMAVTDRKTFKVQSVNGLPTLNSAEALLETRIDGVNGFHWITSTGTHTFTITGSFNDGDYFNGFVKTPVRIAGSATVERAIEQYTKQGLTDMWMFIVAGDAVVSKNRNIMSDARASIGPYEDIRIRVIDGFSIFIIKNTKNEPSAVNAVDISRHELLGPILRSVLGVSFDTGLSSNENFKTMLTGHNFVDYNRATFLYQYSFEVVYDITSNDASVGDDTKAFSKINYTQSIGDDDVTDATISDINLQE